MARHGDELAELAAKAAKAAKGTKASKGAAKTIHPKTLPRPGGMTNPEFGKVIGWTKGGTLEGNLTATDDLIAALPERIGAIKEAGVTSEMAETWAAFYRQEATRVPQNPNALARSRLMAAIAEQLK